MGQGINIPYAHDPKASCYRHEPQTRWGIFINEQDIDDHQADEDDSFTTSSQQQKKKSRQLFKVFIGARPDFNRTQQHTEHDWDFFYHSLLAVPETRSAIPSGKKPVMKLELRTQKATTLSERFGKKQHAM